MRYTGGHRASPFSRGIERQKEAYRGASIALSFIHPVDLFLIPYFET